jgi:Class II flagellar assembly regulator
VAAIEGIGRSGAARPGARAPARASSGFTVPDDAAASAPAATEAAPAAALASMLTLQELGSETAEDAEARRHGHDLLTALAELQRALLLGHDDAATLERLAELAASVPSASDRRLAAIVSAISVRARVELARRHL